MYDSYFLEVILHFSAALRFFHLRVMGRRTIWLMSEGCLNSLQKIKKIYQIEGNSKNSQVQEEDNCLGKKMEMKTILIKGNIIYFIFYYIFL